MMTLFYCIFYTILGFFGLGLLLSIIIAFKYITWFRWRQCPHCGHNMEYKGLKEGEAGQHYLFHCPKCNSWKQIAKEEFIRNCDKDCNPNVL